MPVVSHHYVKAHPRMTDHWNLTKNKQKHNSNFYSSLFSDIQECYEVTLQLNATENAAKENGPKEMPEVSAS